MLEMCVGGYPGKEDISYTCKISMTLRYTSEEYRRGTVWYCEVLSW